MAHAQTLKWTPEQITRFWDYWSQRADAPTYFSQQVGTGVVKFLGKHVPLAGSKVLDFGAGPGHLVERMLASGACVSAVDYSEQTVTTLDQRFAGHPGWEGAKAFPGAELPWPDNSFEVITCVETIEHLLDQHCELILKETFRLLKPGGTALFTTPNNERLQQNFVFCPCCETEFHRWQHVRSWTPTLLRKKLQELGYQVTECRGLNFRSIQRSGLCRVAEQMMRSLLRAADRLGGVHFPGSRFLSDRLIHNQHNHLVAVVQKA